MEEHRSGPVVLWLRMIGEVAEVVVVVSHY